MKWIIVLDLSTTGEKQYVCEICGVHYTQKDSLKFHKLMKHGERQFACKFPNCAKRFFSETSLNRHAFNHLDKNQVKCDKCQRGFTHERHLKSHSPRCPMNDEKQAKRAEEREKLKCKFCPRVCANQSRLKTHMTSHTGKFDSKTLGELKFLHKREEQLRRAVTEFFRN